MKSILIKTLSVLQIISGLCACQQCPDQSISQSTDNSARSINETTVNSTLIIADTIVYDVLIKNPDESDEYLELCTRNVRPRAFLDSIFSAVYKGTLPAYGVLYDAPLEIDEIREIEARENYDRSLIGKMQFTELWKFDPVTLVMQKEVKEILIAYERLDSDANVIGYTVVFKIRPDEFRQEL